MSRNSRRTRRAAPVRAWPRPPSRQIQGIRIDIANRQRRLAIRVRSLRTSLDRALRAESVTDCHIEVALVDDRAIRRLHRQFLGIDSATDVLTFPMHAAGSPLEGVIVVSAETAIREAQQRERSGEDELLLYAIHGILHLCGYDDTRPAAARRMRRRQAQLMRLVHTSVGGEGRANRP